MPTLRSLVPEDPPAPPFRRDFWRSPLRGVRLTSILGATLLVAIPLVSVTGLLSHVAYNPGLGENRIVARGPFDVLLFDWPTHPAWLYAASQGVHVTLGLAAFPIVLAKLWSVIPKLFVWPPARSVAHALERASLALLVGAVLFEFVTGILNIQNYYPWKFNFVEAHYYGAWVFLGAFGLHVGLKFPTMWAALRKPRLSQELADTLAAPAPDPPTISRRGLLGTVGAASVLLAVTGAGQSIGGPFRRLALLAPRGGTSGDGPNAFPVNKTASAVGVGPDRTGASWRLELKGPAGAVKLSREDLLRLDQHAYDLPIACVEGWSTTQRWSGVRLRDLARMAGAADGREVRVQSLQRAGEFRQTTLGADQIADERSLLALRVNATDLSLDHGFPARIIVPALPGVHCTKWVSDLEFTA